MRGSGDGFTDAMWPPTQNELAPASSSARTTAPSRGATKPTATVRSEDGIATLQLDDVVPRPPELEQDLLGVLAVRRCSLKRWRRAVELGRAGDERVCPRVTLDANHE